MLLGGFSRSLAGLLFSSKCLNPHIIEAIGVHVDEKDAKVKTPEEMHLAALNELRLFENSSNEIVKKTRQNFLIDMHEDKNEHDKAGKATDEYDKLVRNKMLVLEHAYHVVVNYRKSNGLWDN